MRWPWQIGYVQGRPREVTAHYCIVPQEWVAVDSERHITATASTFEELRADPNFDESVHTVHHRGWDGKWGQLIGRYGLDQASYVEPGADALMRAVVSDGARRLS